MLPQLNTNIGYYEFRGFNLSISFLSNSNPINSACEWQAFQAFLHDISFNYISFSEFHAFDSIFPVSTIPDDPDTWILTNDLDGIIVTKTTFSYDLTNDNDFVAYNCFSTSSFCFK